MVNTDDLGLLLANWGLPGATWAMGDFNGDGVVNTDDLGLLLSYWGQTGGQTIPEPASLAILGLGALTLVRRRRA